MGRLLDALLGATTGTLAICAIPAIPSRSRLRAENRKIAGIAPGPVDASKQAGQDRQAARLLQVIRDQELPDALLASNDVNPAQLAALTVDELRAYARLLDRSRTMSSGLCPRDYTQRAFCQGCGPVWLWRGVPSVLAACPWCPRRKTGRSIPRPLVVCGDCAHFIPDSINPDGGTGVCGIGLPYRSRERGRHPFASRNCAEHRNRN